MKKFFFSGKKGDEPEDSSDIEEENTVYLTGDDRVDTAKVKTLLNTMAELISNMDPDHLLQTILDRSIRLVGAERGILFQKQQDGKMRIKLARDADGNEVTGQVQYSTRVVNDVMNTGKPVLLKVGAGNVTDLSQSVVDLKLRAVMCVTLSIKERILGVIYVDSRIASREFKPSDLKFFDALANAMAITIENARLVAEYVETERLKESMEIARGIQQGLLPDNPVGLKGFDIAGKLKAVDVAAGDYFDFIEIPGNRLGLVVGDVSGHGVGPAIVMSSVRAMLRGLTHLNFGLGALLEYINDQLGRDTDLDIFMSLFVGAIDLTDKSLVYGSAGHIPQLLYKPEKNEFFELKRTGIALGVDDGARYKASHKMELEPGDLLAFYTDGILERRTGMEMFGMDRLKKLLVEHRTRTAEEIISIVLEEVYRFSPQEVDDDLTLVVVRVLD